MKIYLFLNALFVFFVLLQAIPGPLDHLYDAVLFYFDASFADFKLWFPRHFIWLFCSMVLIKLLAWAFAVYVSYRIIRNLSRTPANASGQDFNAGEFVRRNGKILFCAFVFYLLLYFLLRIFYAGQHYHHIQLYIARGFVLHLLVQAGCNLIVQRQFFVRWMRAFLLEPQLPFSIAVLRIFFFSYLVICYFNKYATALPTVSLPNKVPLPYMDWFIDILPVNPQLYSVFIFIGITACIFVIAGFKTRFFLIVNAVCCFYIMAAPNFFGKLWHEQFPIWISWFFMFSRCYDALSLDALLHKTEIRKSADYTFPVRFVWLQFGIIYFWAGFYKLWDSGFDWALGKSMINQVQLEWLQHYDALPVLRIDKYPVLLCISGLAVILFELSYIFMIARKKWRWMAVMGGLVMHNLIGWFLYIHFIFLQLLYVFYIDFNRLFAKKHAGHPVKTSAVYSRAALYTEIIVVGLNFVCGMFSIDSYPFSAYPKYSATIPDSIEIIHFQCADPELDFHAIGKKNNFRWEDYGWLEDNLIRDFKAGKDIRQRLQDYYLIWVSRNPELRKCGPVDVYIKKRAVSPEGKNNLKTIRYICKLSTCN